MFPLSFITRQCKTVGYCFAKSGALGIDSDDFGEKMMTSNYGIMILTDRRMIEYSDGNFMFGGLERALEFKSGRSYETDILYYAGYLYKYWISTRGEQPPRIWEIAPLRLIATRYNFYHTQDIDYVINDLIERH